MDANLGPSDLAVPHALPTEKRSRCTSLKALAGQLDSAYLSNRAVRVGGIFIIAYFCLAVAAYKPLEGFDVLHCIYFACVIGTTVGYGDFLPTSDLSKLFTVFYIHMASITIAIVLQGVVTLGIDGVLRRMLAEDQGLLIDPEIVRRKSRKRCMTFVLMYVAILMAGTAFFTFGSDLAGQPGSQIVNALYLTVVTMSTVGFGDLSPTTNPGRIFACGLMLVGIPVFATTLGLFSQTLFGERKQGEPMKTVRRLTARKYETMESFCRDMQDMGISDGTESAVDGITRFQFLCFTLVNNGACDLEELQQVMANFKELDRSGNGSLDHADFAAWRARSTSASGSRLTIDAMAKSFGAITPSPSIAGTSGVVEDTAMLPTILSRSSSSGQREKEKPAPATCATIHVEHSYSTTFEV